MRYSSSMNRTALLSKALRACEGNQAELARRLEVGRMVVCLWKKKGEAPRWWDGPLQQVAHSRVAK